MNRPEPKRGDPLIDRGRRTTIERLTEDDGTQLRNGSWVCMSEFEKSLDGVWVRPEQPDSRLPELEMPVSESGPDDLAEAARLVRQDPTPTNELLASVFDKWARMGRVHTDLLNRVGGPETVRLARHLINQARPEHSDGEK